jgi:hypothetical protein
MKQVTIVEFKNYCKKRCVEILSASENEHYFKAEFRHKHSAPFVEHFTQVTDTPALSFVRLDKADLYNFSITDGFFGIDESRICLPYASQLAKALLELHRYNSDKEWATEKEQKVAEITDGCASFLDLLLYNAGEALKGATKI